MLHSILTGSAKQSFAYMIALFAQPFVYFPDTIYLLRFLTSLSSATFVLEKPQPILVGRESQGQFRRRIAPMQSHTRHLENSQFRFVSTTSTYATKEALLPSEARS